MNPILPPATIHQPSSPLSPRKPNAVGSLIADAILNAGVAFTIVLLGYCVALALRGQLFEFTFITNKVVYVVLARSFFYALTIATAYRLTTFGILYTLHAVYVDKFLPQYKTETREKTSLFISSFITASILLATVPLRPILQVISTDPDKFYFSQAFVKYDAIPTAIILFVIAIPAFINLLRQQDKISKIFNLVSMIIVGGFVIYTNLSPNYVARIYEARESWILRDWNKQASQAKQALEHAETGVEKAQAYYWLGVAANRNKHYQEAIDYQTKAIELDATYAAAYSSLSNANRGLGNYEKAQDTAQQCMDFSPGYAWCYYSMAALLSEMGYHEKALILFNKAAELSPYDQELQTTAERVEKEIAELDRLDQLPEYATPPGCLQNPVCTSKNKNSRFVIVGDTPDCLQILNQNCTQAELAIVNNCPGDITLEIDGEAVPSGSKKSYLLGQDPETGKITQLNPEIVTYPTQDQIVYIKGKANETRLVVSFVRTKALCQ